MTRLVLAAALLSMSASDAAAQDGLGGPSKLRPAQSAETMRGAAGHHLALFAPALNTFNAAVAKIGETIRPANADAAHPLNLGDLMQLRWLSAPVATARHDVSHSDTPLRGRWTLDPVSGKQAELEVFWVDDTNWRRTVPLSRFTGLTTRDLMSAVPVPVAFRMEHEAGVFEFEGHIQRGRGTGDFRFTPKREFIQALRSIGLSGIDSVSDHQLKNLAWGGVTSEDIRDFHAHGFSHLDQVVDFAIFGVTSGYVKALSGLGYSSLSASQVIDLWRAGVSPVFIKRMHDAGHAGASPERLIQLHRRR